LLQKENALLKEQNALLQERLAEAEEMLAWFRNQLFGKTSERRVPDSAGSPDGQLSFLPSKPAKKEEPDAIEVKSHKRRGKKAWPTDSVNGEGLRFGPSVPVVEVRVPNPEVDALPVDQKEKVSEEVTFKLAQQRSYFVKKFIREIVKVGGVLLCPPPPPMILPKSIADDTFAVGMMVDKFIYHQPLNRIHQRLIASGIQISRTSLTNWIHDLGELLAPVYTELLRSVLCSKLITMDETPVLAKPESKASLQQCWFWGIYGELDEVVFCFGVRPANRVAT
jgi:hypothetical protein